METPSTKMIDLDKLDPNPFQPRVEYPERGLRELGRSIKQNGLRQPIAARPKGERYEICYGERRVRACRLVGIKQIATIVSELSDEQMAEYALIENLSREDLNPIEKAKGFKSLREKFGWTQERIGKELDFTRDVVAQTLRLLDFPTELQELVSHDTITLSHAEALSRLSHDPASLKEATGKVVEQRLTTKETEHLVDETIKRTGASRLTFEYLTSRNFLLLLRYFLINIYMKIDDAYCPVCFDSTVYEEPDGQQRIKCKNCGWGFDVVSDPIAELIDRIDS